jgi:hypothetical protein
VRRIAVVVTVVLLEAVVSGCGDEGPAAPDAGRILVAQICGADTCTPLEACMTEWTASCEVLNNPPASCIPCSPDGGVYNCPLIGCGTLPPGCTSCACVSAALDPACRCTDSGSSIAVACNEPH